MNKIKLILLVVSSLSSAYLSAEENILPQYEKPSIEFREASPQTIGVSYFACGSDAKSYEAKPSKEDCQLIKDNEGKFSLVTDINKNGVQEILRVGRFADIDGGSGTFLEIVEDGKYTVLRSAEYQRFSHVAFFKGNVIWAWCFECGNFSYIVWRDGKFVDDNPFDF